MPSCRAAALLPLRHFHVIVAAISASPIFRHAFSLLSLLPLAIFRRHDKPLYTEYIYITVTITRHIRI